MSAQTAGAPLLSVRDLVVEIPTRRGVLRPVDGVSFDVHAGEILGVVGESGAGKSITGAAIIRLLERPARIASGSVHLAGRRIDTLDSAALRRVRGGEIGTVFQDPSTSLDPLQRIGDQLAETARLHLSVSRAEARERALQALVDVGIPAAAERLDAYPHQFSGGMRQRVVIALALIGEPALVIADEPTTALDVSVQAQVLALLKQLCRERGTGVMLITHDMGVIAETTDRVAVLYAGRVAEVGPTPAVLTEAAHPYTRGLMASTPNPLPGESHERRLQQIPGSMPGLLSVPSGCAFHPRCDQVMAVCAERRPSSMQVGSSDVWCWLHSELSQT
jgi:peptide/nickel transport system ATP-binding protein